MLVCDSQVHIWAEPSPERPWTPGGAELHRAMGHRAAAIGFEELKALMDEAGVDRVVIAPPTWDLDRNDLAIAAATTYPDRFAVMARVPLPDPDTGRALMDSWRTEPAVKGVRLTFFRPEESTWLTDGTADWYWPLAEEMRLPTMVHAARFKPQIAAIAEAHPDLPLILDHLGVPGDVKDDAAVPFVEETAALARFPNVAVKLSGVPVKSTEPYPFANMDRCVEMLVGAFGARRCYWGTDLSRIIGYRGVTYRQCVTHFTDHLDFLSPDDLVLIMGRALCEALGWPA